MIVKVCSPMHNTQWGFLQASISLEFDKNTIEVKHMKIDVFFRLIENNFVFLNLCWVMLALLACKLTQNIWDIILFK